MLPEGYEYLPGYDTEPEYEDKMVFEIDLEDKTTTMIKGQTLIAGEGFSQAIFFNVPRYADGIDLTEKTIQVPYIGPSGFKDINKVVCAAASEDRIQFAWVVPNGACLVEGTLQFYVEFFASGYALKTQKIELPVLTSFEGVEAEEPVEQEWYITLQNSVSDALANLQIMSERIGNTDISEYGENVTAAIKNIGEHGGGGSEPSQYIKRASVDGNTLTLINKDGSNVDFTPGIDSVIKKMMYIGSGNTTKTITGIPSNTQRVVIESATKVPEYLLTSVIVFPNEVGIMLRARNGFYDLNQASWETADDGTFTLTLTCDNAASAQNESDVKYIVNCYNFD